jgi:hypothetical protein
MADRAKGLWVVLRRGPGPDSDFVELENERGEGVGPASGIAWREEDGLMLLGPFESPPRPRTEGRPECSRSDCSSAAVFEVTDLRQDPLIFAGLEDYEPDGDPTPVCAEHLAELIALARDGCTGVEHWLVTAPDYGLTHLIAEGFPHEVTYG